MRAPVRAPREIKGLEIAALTKIVSCKEGYLVRSQAGAFDYIVSLAGEALVCACPDFQMRRAKCKHIRAVGFMLHREEGRPLLGKGNLA